MIVEIIMEFTTSQIYFFIHLVFSFHELLVSSCRIVELLIDYFCLSLFTTIGGNVFLDVITLITLPILIGSLLVISSPVHLKQIYMAFYFLFFVYVLPNKSYLPKP